MSDIGGGWRRQEAREADGSAVGKALGQLPTRPVRSRVLVAVRSTQDGRASGVGSPSWMGTTEQGPFGFAEEEGLGRAAHLDTTSSKAITGARCVRKRAFASRREIRVAVHEAPQENCITGPKQYFEAIPTT